MAKLTLVTPQTVSALAAFHVISLALFKSGAPNENIVQNH